MPTVSSSECSTTAVAGVTSRKSALRENQHKLTELGSGSLSHKYVLTVIDHFSRFMNVFPMATRTADNVVKQLEMVVEAYGAPKVLLADNAREFRSDKLKEWCR